VDDHVQAAGARLTVTAMQGRRIDTLRVEKLEPEAEGSS